MVKYISDRIGVMYLGNLVEITTSENLYQNPMHPYTNELIKAIPVAILEEEDQILERTKLTGEVPSPVNPPQGCVFSTRCPSVKPECKTIKPKLQEVQKQHFVACHLYE